MSLRYRLRVAITAFAITLCASLTVAVPPAQAYTPGTATAHIYYDHDTPYGPQFKYYCTYDGWRGGAKVTFQCDLYFRQWSLDGAWREFLDTRHSGSWTPPPAYKRTATWSTAQGNGGLQYCVKARALSVDGGDADTTCYV